MCVVTRFSIEYYGRIRDIWMTPNLVISLPSLLELDEAASWRSRIFQTISFHQRVNSLLPHTCQTQ
jgi:hypothetical protein